MTNLPNDPHEHDQNSHYHCEQGWQHARLDDMNKAGISRFRLRGKVVSVGYAASSSPGLGAGIGFYRRGDRPAGKLVVEHLDQLELEIAYLDRPAQDIRNLAKGMIERERPAWNTINRHKGRF